MDDLGPMELRALRLQKGPSQAEVARHLGVSTGLYSAYEMPGSGKSLEFDRLVEDPKVFALGEPLGDERRPRWLVARLDVGTGLFIPVIESRKRRRLEQLPAFRGATRAIDVAEFVAKHYPLSAVRAIPAWHGFLVETLTRHGLPADDWYLADREDPTRLGQALIMGLRIIRRAKLAEVNTQS